MPTLTIALLQMTAARGNADANLDKGLAFCRQAAQQGADLALFPESWQLGTTNFDPQQPEAREKWIASAIARDSAFIQRHRELASELDMAIAVTYLEQWPGLPRNSVSLIDRHGRLVMTYAKVHTCDFQAGEATCTPGDDFHVCDLDTRAGTVKVGAMICFDREFPESARLLMLKGAEVVLTPNACPLAGLPIRLTQFQTRAFENAMVMAMTNYAAPQLDGHSIVYDAAGQCVIEADDREGVFLANIDLDTVRAHRAQTIFGNAFRRPHRYGLLTQDRTSTPFLRSNKFGQPFVNRER